MESLRQGLDKDFEQALEMRDKGDLLGVCQQLFDMQRKIGKAGIDLGQYLKQ